MSDVCPSLPDVLAQVPDLLPQCMPHIDGRGARIRDLRLISKATSVTAMREVTSCSVQLGEGAWPNPGQVVRLMRHSKLHSLTVVIITTSADTGPSLAQQLATCTSQITELVQSMETAIRSVTHLTVKVQHTLPKNSSSPAAVLPTLTEDPHSCPPSFSVISRAICTALAVAVPLLGSLRVDGCCHDAALEVFGSICTKLSDLQIEAPTVPLKALWGLDRHLPNLHCLKLWSTQQSPLQHPPSAQTEQYCDRLAEYVGRVLHTLQASTSLTRLVLDFDTGASIRCTPGGWRHVPPNLHDFVSRHGVRDLHHARELLANIRSLFVASIHKLDLLDVVRSAPNLQILFVLETADVLLRCDAVDAAPGIALLSQRMRKGLHMVVPSIVLEGSPASVQAALAELPRLYNTRSVQVRLHGDVPPGSGCLVHISQVFSGLETLVLWSYGTWQGPLMRGVELLRSLKECACLRNLQLRMPLAFTTAQLAGLFQGIRGLAALGYVENEGVELEGVRERLAAVRHFGAVEEYSRCDIEA